MGGLVSTWQMVFPPKARWSASQIPDLTGRVMIVTGGNSGVGFETVKALLQHNAKVYLAARNRSKAESAIEELKKQTGKEAIFLELDLADLRSVKRAADEFLRKENELHALFNNGGTMLPHPKNEFTAQGYDLQFGTNVLGHFYLTKLLLPILVSTALQCPEKKTRIVNTSSLAHVNFPKLEFEAFKGDSELRTKIASSMYAQSKFGNIVFSNELARRYRDQGIVSTSVHPGNLTTALQNNASPILLFLFRWILYPADMGALTQLWAGTTPEGLDMNGQYLIPWARLGKASHPAEDPVLGKKFWEYLESQVDLFESEYTES
ncbi:NAD(P)-binding protein [Dendrothele bispora CBS 962.96]|uniref:NAD(P)-binding protein n=1 Tax=Dendrothele bispora (strain CBS 962.96) TaxID=1314807 RepID=A0A4S8MTI0_DENBC|nr:NAD(P)-binding protein [Dendrothele bispora CBS 962.96]